MKRGDLRVEGLPFLIHVPVRKSRRASAPQTDKARKFRKKPLFSAARRNACQAVFHGVFHFGQRFEMREDAERIKSICPGFLGENRAEEVILCYSGFGKMPAVGAHLINAAFGFPAEQKAGFFGVGIAGGNVAGAAGAIR